MHITNSSLMGVMFLVLSFAATFTMFHFWGYPYDKENRKSSCPQWKMNIHRGIGFAYIAVYVLMMIEMVPRLWEYQVELPARTVAHLLLGSFIGIILIIKVSIIRFFRHLEEWMPALGTSLLVSSVLLGILSLPTVFREASLAEAAYSKENRARVARLLPEAGFPEGVDVAALSTLPALVKGRRVLLEKCVDCHDLKTVIAKPRTPSNWVRTSQRMVEKPSLAGVLSAEEGHYAAAYLIAITPDLQRSAKSKRAGEPDVEDKQAASELLGDELSEDASDAEVVSPDTSEDPDADDEGKPTNTDLPPDTSNNPAGKQPTQPKTGPDTGVEEAKAKAPTESKPKAPAKPAYSLKKAKARFMDECSQCHDASDTDDEPPKTKGQVNSLLRRMIDNGWEFKKSDLAIIRWYLVQTYVTK